MSSGNASRWILGPWIPGGSGPSLHRVGRAAAPGLSRTTVDTGSLRYLAQVFRDAAEVASTAAFDETPVLGRTTAVALAFVAAKGPSLASLCAEEAAPPVLRKGTAVGLPQDGRFYPVVPTPA